MSSLNIRDIDPELVAKVKAIAAVERKDLRVKVIDILEKYVADFQLGGENERK